MARFKPLLVTHSGVFQSLSRRLLNSIRQVIAIRQERQARVLIFFSFSLFLLLVMSWWASQDVFAALSINLLAGAIGGIVGVYFSLEIIRPYVRTISRQRIDPASEILDSYADMFNGNNEVYPDFIQLDEVAMWNEERSHSSITKQYLAIFPNFVEQLFGHGLSPELPLTTMYEPSEIRSIDSFSCVRNDSRDLYSIPESLEAILEPYKDDLREMFLKENRKNEPKVRLDEYRDGTFIFSKTTYYRSFLTNFCPDYPPRNTSSIRKLTVQFLFDETGETIPLSESPFSNHLGGGGLIITTGGKILVSTRRKSVAVEGNCKHLSFSASFDYINICKYGLKYEIEHVIRDETGIQPENVIEISPLGITRRVERLGKPDLVTLVLVEEAANWGVATDQFISMDAVSSLSGDDVRIETLEELFSDSRADDLTRSLFQHLNESAYPPSLGLSSAIYLLDSLASKTQVPY